MLCGLGFDLSCLEGGGQKQGTDCFPCVCGLPELSVIPPHSGLSAALEISVIVKSLSLKQHEATVFTGAPGQYLTL